MKISMPQAAPHVRNPGRVPSLMGTVIRALLPATLFAVYLFGWPALNLLLLCLVSALMVEALCLRCAGKPVKDYLMDGSGVLTALLLALTLPPWAPWWIAVGGSAFAVLVGKQVFGGIGQNPFNPAMLARAALLLSFPLEMTSWTVPTPLLSAAAPDFLEGVRITFLEGGATGWDARSGATLLGQVKTELSQGNALPQALSGGYSPLASLLGDTPGSLGETSALLILLGGLYLLYHRVIGWQIPISLLLSLSLLAGAFWLYDPQRYADPVYHLSSGGVLLGAFFIATDPVTSPCTKRGQLLFGAGCGLMTYLIRTWGGYPEGVAFAVLFMNALTPLIDHYVRPRRYGQSRQAQPGARSAWRFFRQRKAKPGSEV